MKEKVSSMAGYLKNVGSSEIRSKFSREDLTVEELSELMEAFIEATKTGSHAEQGWTRSTYSASKVGMSALTRIWAREWETIDVSACCPGWCRTNMAGDKAPKSAAQGALTPVWLATRPESNNGRFFTEEREGVW